MKKINIFALITKVWKYVNKKVKKEDLDKAIEEMDVNKDDYVSLGEVIVYIINKVVK